MLNHIYKFGRVLENVGRKNPTMTCAAILVVVVPIISVAVHFFFQTPMLALQVMGGVVAILVLGITAKRIYEEYGND